MTIFNLDYALELRYEDRKADKVFFFARISQCAATVIKRKSAKSYNLEAFRDVIDFLIHIIGSRQLTITK